MDKSEQQKITPQQSKKVAFALGLAVIVFLLGTLFGTTLSKDPEVKEVEVEKNAALWQELKEIDDRAFQVAINNSELSAAAFYAVSQGDTGTIEAVTTEVEKNTDEFNVLGEKRKEILKKLGY